MWHQVKHMHFSSPCCWYSRKGWWAITGRNHPLSIHLWGVNQDEFLTALHAASHMCLWSKVNAKHAHSTSQTYVPFCTRIDATKGLGPSWIKSTSFCCSFLPSLAWRSQKEISWGDHTCLTVWLRCEEHGANMGMLCQHRKSRALWLTKKQWAQPSKLSSNLMLISSLPWI